MKEILKYIKKPIDLNDVSDIEIPNEKILEQYYKKLSSLYPSDSKKENDLMFKSIGHDSICQGQIWLTHKTYIDYIGNIIDGVFPLYVYVENGPLHLGDLSFVRVQPISAFLEFANIDDIVVANDEITGFNFFIETWNEQPVSLEVLNTYIGEINITEYEKNKNRSMIESHKNFRKAEIKNSSYLRSSVTSYLIWEENCQSEKSGVVFNAGNVSTFPIRKQVKHSQPQYLYAAKNGIECESENYSYSELVNDKALEITIIKNVNYFTIIVNQISEMILKNEDGEEVEKHYPDNGSNIVYEELRSGLFQLFVEGKKEPINIRVK